MSAEADPLVSIQFVFAECKRMQARLLSGEKVMPNSPEAMEFFYKIPHPEVSWSFLVCGRAADQGLQDLARRAALHAGISHQVSNAVIRDKLAEVIVRKFLKEKRPLDRKNVDRALSEAAKLAARGRETITHYVPCHLMVAQKPDQFDIGPVHFRTQRSFRAHLAPIVSTARVGLRRSGKFISRALRYYRSFSWVAEVTVSGCDRPTSKEVAARAVAAALDCLHLLLEPRYTYKMSIGGPDLSRDWRGSLSVSDSEGLGYSIGYTGAGSVSFEEDWWQRFEHESYARALHLCGIALESVVDPSFERPLSRRFLDAALWFGEAVRERSLAAKVVKYATALERMVMTDEQDDITSLMSGRIAAICCENPDDSFDSWQRDAQRLYALRSRLVHGSISPHSNAFVDGIALGAKLGEATLLQTLLAFGEVGLKEEKVGQKRLANWFNRIVSHVSEARGKAP
ncbi:MAG TPA: hypothetical protein VK614_07460 [Allosphingosinicella sp.]|nr:hypothetical protein [Allosphingosinicella sp.]